MPIRLLPSNDGEGERATRVSIRYRDFGSGNVVPTEVWLNVYLILVDPMFIYHHFNVLRIRGRHRKMAADHPEPIVGRI